MIPLWAFEAQHSDLADSTCFLDLWLVEEMSNGSMSLSSVTQVERGPWVQGSRKQNCGQSW